MKRTLVIFSILLALTCFSEEIIINENDFNVNVISSTDQHTIIEYNFGNFERIPVEIDGETFYRLSLGKESETYEKGDPELPKITRSIIIPDNAMMKINVLEKDYVEYHMKIIPSKGILSRQINPDDVPYEFSETYTEDKFYPENTSDTNSPYILRDFRGIAIHAYPFAYNPVTQTLRVYHHLALEVTNVGFDTENIKTRDSNNINKYFKEIYQNHFINFSADRYTSVDEQGRMLVICYDSFESSIQPYVDWKNQKGIDTELHILSSIGSSATDILNFIQSEYDENNGLTFVQLVGDDVQMPYFTHSCSNGTDAADPKYALLEGSDNYPEIFIGRFSAETSSEVDTQVDRTIHYERDISSGAWLGKAFGIGSDEGAGIGDDGEADFVHIGNIRTDLLGYTYTEVDEIYDPGASSITVITALNEGRSFGTYCGHGSNNSWSTTGFSTLLINTLTNDNMLPIICDVACVNGNFTGITCFAETWMRATNNGNPTGAISIYASTINQSWAPPMSAQDEVADLLCGTGPYAGSGNQKNSIGGLMYNGSCLMMDEYGSGGEDMFLTWTIFGDVSLQVRTDTPSTMAISHDSSILVDQTSFNISIGVEGALACLYNGTDIIGSGYSSASGDVTLTLNPIPNEPTDLALTITAYNKTTSVETIPVIANGEPEILVDPTTLSQELEPDQTDIQSFDITNNGDTGTTLTYGISWVYTITRSFDLESRPKDMSIAEYNKLYINTRDEAWLDVTPISGSCTYNETDPISCDFNSTGLAEGTYTATITISNNAGTDEYVNVTLDVDTPGGTTPVNPRAIAEFELMEGVLVRYPFGVPVSLISEMSEDVMVTTIVANAGEESTVTSTYTSNGVNLANCNFEYSPTDSYWIRDYGPWWVDDGSDDISVIDFTYNRPRPNDNNIPGEMASFLSEEIYLMGLEHAGGNYMTDGMGIAASTELVWEENPSLTHPEINQIMGDYLGIQTYHVVPDPNGTYIDHIDCWGKFLDVDKILIREVPTGHSQYDEIEATVDYFEAQTSSYGTPYEIYRVYTPNDEPYTNSLILNNKVIVPTMNSSEDTAALAVYETAMPGYEVLGFYDSSWEGTDAIHCRLRGVADRNMLYVNHIPLSGTIPNTRADYEINATIVPYSGQPVYNDSLLVYYKVDGGTYTSVTMTHQSGNDYLGIIPEQTGGSEIVYYIHTADQSGQSANHPFIGASDPHLFNVSGPLESPVNVQIQIVGTEVQLSWDVVSGATKYNVFRSTDPYTGFARITPYPAGIAANSYIDTLSVEKYFYYITAE